MTMASKILNLKCPKCQGAKFEIRVLKDEGLAAAKCVKCNRDYLMLDSEDYWFDVIQQGFPRISQCSCKSTTFNLKCDYFLRDDGDVETIAVWTICSSCSKIKRRMTVKIDYCDTQGLINDPLVFCKNPQILYDLREATLYATRDDIALVAAYLESEAKCNFYCCLSEKGERVVRQLGIDDVKKKILSKTFNAYSWLYASPTTLKISLADVETAKKENSFWKRNQVIRIAAPLSIGWPSSTLLYYINFSSEYVKDESIIKKSAKFRKTSDRLLEWLAKEFVSWRGSNCFDNPKVHTKAFGERFRAKAQNETKDN